jgi:integrase
MLTFVRSGELRGARWEEFDFEKRDSRAHEDEGAAVPLSDQAIVVLEEIRKFRGDSSLLFPCRTDAAKPISDNTLSKAFRDQGYRGKATPYSLRFKTILPFNHLPNSAKYQKERSSHNPIQHIRQHSRCQ